MRRAAILALTASGCSFIGVRGPGAPTDLITDPAAVRCTESGALPALDALGGAAAIAAAGAGIILQHSSDDGAPKHFDLIYAPILLAVSIAYWSAASFGTNRVEQCREIKERRTAIKPIPIQMDPPKQDPDIQLSPAD